MSDDVVTGTLEITERDLVVPMYEMLPFFRYRWVLLGLVVLFYGAVAAMRIPMGAHALVSVLAFGASFVGMAFVLPRVSARRVLRALTRTGGSHLMYRLDAEGITIQASGSTTTFAYRRILRAREGSTALLVYCNPTVANIIPKRAFSEEDLGRVRRLISAHVAFAPIARPWWIVLWVVMMVAFLAGWQLLSSPPK